MPCVLRTASPWMKRSIFCGFPLMS
jgi:hypothetical protein